MQRKSVALCLVYVCSLSTTVEITFIVKKNQQKKQLNFFKLRLLLYVKNRKLSSFFYFHLSFPKTPCKSALLSIIKLPYKSVLLSIITCRHLSLTSHTQKYFIKAFYYLTKTWLCVT